MSNFKPTDYKCLKCGHEWNQPQGGPAWNCPKCGHLYAKWKNFKDFVKDREKK